MPDVLPKHIPYPGICNSDDSLSWHCARCDGVMPILQADCPVCRAPRDRDLDPWVDLAQRRGRPDDSPAEDPDDEGRAPRHSPAFYRFVHSIPSLRDGWRDESHTYDLDALREVTVDERKQVVDLFTGMGELTWREIDGLAVIGDLDAGSSNARNSALQSARRHHLSIDARLAAAEQLHRAGLLDEPLENVIARELRALSEPRNGLTRALMMARQHPTEQVQQALLWASWNQTNCSSACVATLMDLRGVQGDTSLQQRLGLHNSHFTRQAAFDELCARVGMTLDITQWS